MTAAIEAKVFTEGQKVEWKSSSNGSTTTKVGTVVAVVPAKTLPQIAQLADKHGAGSQFGHGMVRDHQSYVVLVPPLKGMAKPMLYWPRARALKEATA